MKQLIRPEFIIGNLGNDKATDEVRETCELVFKEEEPGEATLLNQVNHKLRKCYTNWIPTDSVNFINEGFANIIRHCNDQQWKLPLDNQWESHIQYTRYVDKGHHYGWHKDYYPECVALNEKNNMGLRRISIVYCLSHKKDYVGGEFQIQQDDSVFTHKFNYGDFIVFPSTVPHRVKPLKKGQRITLVGWYA